MLLLLLLLLLLLVVVCFVFLLLSAIMPVMPCRTFHVYLPCIVCWKRMHTCLFLKRDCIQAYYEDAERTLQKAGLTMVKGDVCYGKSCLSYCFVSSSRPSSTHTPMEPYLSGRKKLKKRRRKRAKFVMMTFHRKRDQC